MIERQQARQTVAVGPLGPSAHVQLGAHQELTVCPYQPLSCPPRGSEYVRFILVLLSLMSSTSCHQRPLPYL